MPVTLLMWLGLGGFFAAAAVGAALLLAHAQRRHVPIAPAFLHGFFAGGGLISLIVAVVYGGGGSGGGIGPWEIIALAVFLVAATLGATLFYLHYRTGSLPVKLGLAHGGVAVTGIVMLFLLLLVRSYRVAPPPLDPAAPPPAEQSAPNGTERPLGVSPRAEPPDVHGAEQQTPVPGAHPGPLHGPPTIRERQLERPDADG